MIWLVVVAGAYMLLLFGVAWFSLHPFRIPLFVSPGFMGAPQEDVGYETDDGVSVRAWWTQGPPGGPVFLLFHGYMMNRCELTPMAYWLWKRGCSCLLPDLRAHGRSGGKKTGLGVLEVADVEAAVAWAKSRVPGAPIVLVGSSMGAVACGLAFGKKPDLADCAILDSAFSRLSKAIGGWWEFIASRVWRVILAPVLWFAWPLAGFNPFRVDLAKSISGVDGRRLLWVHGDADVLATPEEARRNSKATTPEGRILWMPGCRHSEGRWVHPEAFYEGVLGFLSARGILFRTDDRNGSSLDRGNLGDDL